MRTRKKNLARNAARDRASSSPSVGRPGKVLENAQIVEKKVAELITSSTRKQKFGVPSKICREVEPTKNLNTNYSMESDENERAYLGVDDINRFAINHKGCNEAGVPFVYNTIFSPGFHVSKDVVGGISNGVDLGKFSMREDGRVYGENGTGKSQNGIAKGLASLETSHSKKCEELKNLCENVGTEVLNNCNNGVKTLPHQSNYWNINSQLPTLESNFLNGSWNEDINGANILSEVSAIYLAMQQPKFGYIDEADQHSFSAEVFVEADDSEEIDDFDPYLFIKNLPDLSSVVPTFRHMLLPKQTRSCPPTTLVLDLDETLVHSSLLPIDDADFTFTVNLDLNEHIVYVRCRPHLKDFMEKVANRFETIIFTASQSVYAEQLLNILDPKRRVFRHRIYRESCVYVEGNYVKDLSVLGRDLAHVIIVDNSPQAFGFQLNNGVPIESWFDDPSDQELLTLLPFLESLVEVDDVRPLIAKRFNLSERVAAAAVHPSLNSFKGELFESWRNVVAFNDCLTGKALERACSLAKLRFEYS